jgi:DNA-binding response OmpR family regulator
VPQPLLLVVEDDPVILQLLQINFEMEGFEVRIAHDGVEALGLVRELKPAVVISDIMMPHKSGLELLDEIRRDDAIAATPVILLSAKAQTADVRRGLDAGADDYVTKPFEPLDLVERVNRLVAR